MIPRRIQELEGFGTKNVLLISGVALVLFVFAVSQKPFHLGNASQIALAPTPTANSSTTSSNSTNSGAVLGAVSYDQQLASSFSQIAIKTTADNSADSLTGYGEQINIVAVNDNLNRILGLTAAPETTTAQDKFLSDLEKITVPDSLADYHRMLIGYYGLRFAKQSGLTDATKQQDLDTILGALQNQLQSLKDSYGSSNINLLAVS